MLYTGTFTFTPRTTQQAQDLIDRIEGSIVHASEEFTAIILVGKTPMVRIVTEEPADLMGRFFEDGFDVFTVTWS